MGSCLGLPGDERAGSSGRRQSKSASAMTGQHQQGGEHQVDLHAGVGVQHQVAEAGAGRRPTRRSRRRSAPPPRRRAGRRPRPAGPPAAGSGPGCASAARIHGPGELEPAGLGAPQAVEEGRGDREVDDQHRHRDLGGHAVAQPQHQQRRQREHGHRLAARPAAASASAGPGARPRASAPSRHPSTVPSTMPTRISVSGEHGVIAESRPARNSAAATRERRPAG